MKMAVDPDELSMLENDGDFDTHDATQFAKLELKGTSTINPQNPRTIAAGYDNNTGTMTVVFPKNVWWNYYNVPEAVWLDFKAAYSKGRFLRSNGFDSGVYDMGAVDMGNMSSRQRSTLNTVARDAARMQQLTRGLQRQGETRGVPNVPLNELNLPIIKRSTTAHGDSI
jgi:hypothetical protein